jgi:hypothetical protein
MPFSHMISMVVSTLLAQVVFAFALLGVPYITFEMSAGLYVLAMIVILSVLVKLALRRPQEKRH